MEHAGSVEHPPPRSPTNGVRFSFFSVAWPVKDKFGSVSCWAGYSLPLCADDAGLALREWKVEAYLGAPGKAVAA